MSTSSHARYRDALNVVSDDAAVPALVSDAGQRFGWWVSERRWRRIYGRFMPGAPAFATLAFTSDVPSQQICRVDVFERRPDATGRGGAVCDIDAGFGWARVTRFPDDPHLSGLPTVAADATVVRYRPGRRCTLRTTNRGRTVFAKVYATDQGGRVFRDLIALERAAARGALQMVIAEPISWDTSTRTLWQAALPGQPAVEHLRGPHGDNIARRIGTAAASLSRAAIAPLAVMDGQAVLARSRRHAADLVSRVATLSGLVYAIVGCLADLHARFPSRDLKPVHGAPHPDQWLVAESGVGLVDFDRFGLGDPEVDAGVILADFNALDNPVQSPGQLAASLLAAYRDAGVAVREPLLRAYSAHRQLARALHAAQAIRPDGDRRAEKHAVAALRMLTEAVPA